MISFEDDEDFEIQRKPPVSSLKNNNKEQVRASFDFSQIKDRVAQMEIDEEIILEGAVAEALLAQDLEDYTEQKEQLVYDENDIIRIKEQRKNRFEEQEEPEHEVLLDYIPITSKSDYWLTQDTQESELVFNSTTNSRLVREDFFNEREVDDASGAFTSFIGTASGRKGLMMTSRMLERDMKTQDYDFELVEHDDETVVDNVDDVVWEQAQMLKGMEKGWDQTGDSFIMKQSKLTAFNPPPKLRNSVIDYGDSTQALKGVEENIKKIDLDTEQIEAKRKELEAAINGHRDNVNRLAELETFFMRYSRFIREKLTELNEVDDFDRWEHFFDHIDDIESDLLDLPAILNKARSLNCTSLSITQLKELTELFVKYHFKAIEYGREVGDVWESSGLKQVLGGVDVKELLEAIYGDEIERFAVILSV